MKKVLALILAVLMCVALVACGDSTDDEDTTTTTAPVSGDNNVSGGSVNLTVRSGYAPGDWQTALFTLAAEDWAAATGNTFTNVADTMNETYKSQIITEFLSGNIPDVLHFFFHGEGDALADAGVLVSIEEIQKEYPEYAQDHNINSIDAVAKANDGNHYYVPGPGYSEALFANKAVLEDCGLEVPDANTTYEEWLEMLAVIKAKGYIPLADSFDPEEGLHYTFEYLVLNNETDLDSHADLTADTNAAWDAAATEIKELYAAGYLMPDTSVGYGACFDALNNGEAAFFTGGSWSYNGANDDIVITYFPAKADGTRVNTDIIGGISAGFAITRKAWDDTSKREALVEFVNTVYSAGALVSYGEWRNYTLTAEAAKTARLYGPNADWDAAYRVSDPTYDAPELTAALVTSQEFTAGITGMYGAAQDGLSKTGKSTLWAGLADIATGKKTGGEDLAKAAKAA